MNVLKRLAIPSSMVEIIFLFIIATHFEHRIFKTAQLFILVFWPQGRTF